MVCGLTIGRCRSHQNRSDGSALARPGTFWKCTGWPGRLGQPNANRPCRAIAQTVFGVRNDQSQHTFGVRCMGHTRPAATCLVIGSGQASTC